MTQKHQMEKITFCLLNSGNGNMENLAFHLFKSNKNSGQNTVRGSINGSTKKKLVHWIREEGAHIIILLEVIMKFPIVGLF